MGTSISEIPVRHLHQCLQLVPRGLTSPQVLKRVRNPEDGHFHIRNTCPASSSMSTTGASRSDKSASSEKSQESRRWALPYQKYLSGIFINVYNWCLEV